MATMIRAATAAASTSDNLSKCSQRGSSHQRARSASFLNNQLFATWPRQRRNYRRPLQHVVRASATQDGRIYPMKLESPVGQFLETVLQSHPHLFNAAADQQLELLVADKEASKHLEESKSKTGSELVLYRRIAEVKDQERHRAVVEFMYAVVVQKFLSHGVNLIPQLPTDYRTMRVRKKEINELEGIHSPEVLDVVQGRLKSMLGDIPMTNIAMDHATVLQDSKLKIGQIYALNVIFGYFIRRLDQLYQLDKRVKNLSSSHGEESAATGITGVSEDMDFKADVEGQKLAQELHEIVEDRRSSSSADLIFPQGKLGKLKSYASSLEPETIKRLTTLSKVGLEVVERQTQALFGKPQVEHNPDGNIFVAEDHFIISLAGFRRLFLESIAFGSFLWEAETYMDTLVV